MSKTSRRQALQWLALAGTAAALPHAAQAAEGAGLRRGQVFTSSNATTGNELLVLSPAADGTLSLRLTLPTGGLGTGLGLGSQGAVTTSGDGRYVFVVNAMSNTVTTFRIDGDTLVRASVVASGGLHPISIAEREGIVYVLNDFGEGNIAGFRNVHGQLKPLPGAVQPLSVATGALPAQVGFGSDGRVLVVTEKGTHRITTYLVDDDGIAGAPVVTASAGLTPFGFAFDARNHLFVSEALGGAPGGSATSSYRFSDQAPGLPLIVSPSVPTTQTAACWLVLSRNRQWAYVSNAGSSSVSSYRISPAGKLALVDGAAGSTGEGASASDMAMARDGRNLYVRAGTAMAVAAFTVNADGSLTRTPGYAGLPPTAVGLAAN